MVCMWNNVNAVGTIMPTHQWSCRSVVRALLLDLALATGRRQPPSQHTHATLINAAEVPLVRLLLDGETQQEMLSMTLSTPSKLHWLICRRLMLTGSGSPS